MADLLLSIPTGEISLSASTAKTAITALAPANQRLKIVGFEIFGKGIVVTDTPIKIEFNRLDTTTAGTGTAISPPAPTDEDYAETPQGTYKVNYSAEPTVYGANLRTMECHPQTGIIFMFPKGTEIKIKGGGKLGMRLTASQNQTVAVNLLVEE